MSKGLNDGMPHVSIFERHTSHVTIDVLNYIINNSIHLLQLPSHSSQIAQPLDICAFGIFKRNITTTITRLPGANGMRMPI